VNEDNDLLCRQLLRIVAQVRTGAHVESQTVSVSHVGETTIYGVTISLVDARPEPPLRTLSELIGEKDD
jgi:hypothetical protein